MDIREGCVKSSVVRLGSVGQRIHQPVNQKKKKKAKAEPPWHCVWAGEIHAMLFRGAFPQHHILFTEELKLSYTGLGHVTAGSEAGPQEQFTRRHQSESPCSRLHELP